MIWRMEVVDGLSFKKGLMVRLTFTETGLNTKMALEISRENSGWDSVKSIA